MKASIKGLVTVVAALATAVSTASPSQARDAWDTTPVAVTHNVAPTPAVIDVRVAEHARFDRVVIDLRGMVPGYDVRYVRTLRYDGSGERVPLRGQAFLAVRLSPARAHDAAGDSVYRGPRLRQYQFPALRGAAFTGDFEGRVSFGLALRSRDTFRVFELRQPNRIVIDVHH